MALRTEGSPHQHRAQAFYSWRWLTDHSLSLTFALLFAGCLAGQSVSGHLSYNSVLAMHGRPMIGYLTYLTTGNFLDGAFVNWQAALLQLACLIVFAAKLHERGAAHALSPGAHRKHKEQNTSRPWIYRHSFSLAFAALFTLSFVAHLFFGAMDHNAGLEMIHRPPLTIIDYGLSSTFWFSNTQTWEAEFAALAIYIVLSIFLRQQDSPESKTMESSNRVTGNTNR
jgi:hypothetical protein